jgi:fatty-acyl-CoA synthase
VNVPLTPLRCLRYAEQQFPTKTAIVCGTQRFSYAQFGDRAARLAGGLRNAGVRPGDRVAFLSMNCHRLLEAYYGVLDAGAVLLPLNIRLAPEELAYILNDSGATMLFVQKPFVELARHFHMNVPTVRRLFQLDGEPEETWLASMNYEELLADSRPHRADIMEIDENSLAELFYTSGTSANPKGVMLTHRNIYLHAVNVLLALGTRSDAVQLHTIPLFHANGWGAAHSITFVGASHVMIQRFDPEEVFRLIERERVRTCTLVPIMASALVNSPVRQNYDLSSLEWIIIGGSASSPTLVRQVETELGCACFSGYGLTETAPSLSISRTKFGVEWDGEQHYAGQAMTGYAMPGVELRVVDPNDVDTPADGTTIGEVIARTDGVMEGYWGQPEATAETLRGGWLHTGDMATMSEDAYVLIRDRKKDIIISGGENISSLDIEKTLMAHPDVYDVAVIPVPDRKWGEVPKALVVLKPRALATELELVDFCRAHLAHYKAPRSVEFIETLPKNAAGKTLKKDLRKKYWPDEARAQAASSNK